MSNIPPLGPRFIADNNTDIGRRSFTPAHLVCLVGGSLSLVLGLVGFVSPTIFNMHLSVAHNVIHILLGSISLWIGLVTGGTTVRACSLLLGIVYLAFGVLGLILGLDTAVVNPNNSYEPYLWVLVDQSLMFGTTDHILHLMYGMILVVSAKVSERNVQ